MLHTFLEIVPDGRDTEIILLGIELQNRWKKVHVTLCCRKLDSRRLKVKGPAPTNALAVEMTEENVLPLQILPEMVRQSSLLG